MSLRKMVVRSLVVLILVLVGGSYYAFQHWTHPHAVRELVLRHLAGRVPGAEVRLTAAELRLLGGVNLQDLRFLAAGAEEPVAVLPEVSLQLDRESFARGELVLRKATIRRPQVLLVRRADGTWNVSGLAATRRNGPALPIPVIDIQGGTLQLVDETIAAPPLRLSEVSLTLTPLTEAQMKLEGSAEVELLGRGQLTGLFDSRSGGLVLALKLPRVDLTPALMERLVVLLPYLKREPVELAGRLAISAEVIVQPEAPQPLVVRASAHLTHGRLLVPTLPLPMQQIEACLDWDGAEVTVRQATGQVQGGQFRISGRVHLDGTIRVEGDVRGCQLTPAVYGKLPPVLRTLCHEFRPEGELDLQGHLELRGGQASFGYRVKPRQLRILFEDFPYPLEQITGTLVYCETGSEPTLEVNLTGRASGQPVKLSGQAFGLGLRPDNDLKCGFTLTMEAEQIPIDETLLDALRPYPQTQKLARQFKASGKVSGQGRLERAAGQQPGLRPPLTRTFRLHLHDASFTFEEFPCRLEKASAMLEVGPKPDAWRFHNFRGHRDGATVSGSGTYEPSPDGDRLRLELEAIHLRLDDELKEALPPQAREVWDHFQPTGSISGRLVYEQVVGKQPPTVELWLYPLGGTVKPACFPYMLSDLRGQIHYRAPLVTLNRLSARHGSALLAVREGTIIVRPGNGFRIVLQDLTASRLMVDKDLLGAVPSLLRSALQTLQPDQPLRLAANLVIDDPGPIGSTRCSWGSVIALDRTRLHCGIELSDVSGTVTLTGMHDGQRLFAKGQMHLQQATFLRQPFHDLQSQLHLTNEEILLNQFHGRLHSGTVQGEVRVAFTSATHFTVDLLGQQIDLGPLMQAALGRSTEVKGKLQARLLLTGAGADLRSLRGQGRIRVEEGARIYDVPLIFELINHFSRHLPKNTSFQEAEAVFDVAGEQLKIHRLLLSSAALTLRGQGEMKADGTELNLEMYGLPYGRAVPLLPPLIDRIPPTLSKQLMKIRLRGSLSNVQISTEPLPAVVDPVVDMFRTFTEAPGRP